MDFQENAASRSFPTTVFCGIEKFSDYSFLRSREFSRIIFFCGVEKFPRIQFSAESRSFPIIFSVKSRSFPTTGICGIEKFPEHSILKERSKKVIPPSKKLRS